MQRKKGGKKGRKKSSTWHRTKIVEEDFDIFALLFRHKDLGAPSAELNVDVCGDAGFWCCRKSRT